MQDIDTKEIVKRLILQAQEDQHTKPHLITTWKEYRFYINQARSLKVVIKVLRNSEASLFKSYCKGIAKGEAEFSKMIACLQVQDIIDYYDQEYEIIKGMNTEYDNYLGECNFINFILTLFGAERDN
jgi:hypothetical protein